MPGVGKDDDVFVVAVRVQRANVVVRRRQGGVSVVEVGRSVLFQPGDVVGTGELGRDSFGDECTALVSRYGEVSSGVDAPEKVQHPIRSGGVERGLIAIEKRLAARRAGIEG